MYKWNEFKNKVKGMSTEEKKDLLNDLRAELMVARMEAKKGAGGNMNRPKSLRKQIAYVKTVLNYKGYSYNPR